MVRGPSAWEDLRAETVQREGCRTCSISPTVLLAAFLPVASREQKSPVTLEASSSTDCVRDTLGSLALTTRGDQRLARRGAEGAIARRAALGSATQLRLALRVTACCIVKFCAVSGE